MTKIVSLGAFEFSEENLLGQGSFGTVYKGTHKQTGTGVAVKKVANQDVKQNEIELLNRMDKGNDCLVQLIAVHAQKDVTFLIMELCNADLNDHLETEGPLQLHDMRIVLDCLARGYEELNHKKVVHRDIKPQNILLKYSPEGTEIVNAKLTDFSLCRESDDGMSNVAGSMFYMAPEVGACLLGNADYDSSIDMWSIGCVLFQCLTGEIPFDERTLCRLFLHASCANYDAVKAPNVPDATPESVRILVNLLLQMDPDKRPTAREFFELATEWARMHNIRKRKGNWNAEEKFWHLEQMWPGPVEVQLSKA